LEELAARTENLSGAELASLCARAALCALRRSVAQSGGADNPDIKVTIGDADLLAALEQTTHANF
jgi:SpoVK/Ycf46/Vps4 family AAA+-type ATPase